MSGGQEYLLQSIGRSDLRYTISKIWCWKLIQFRKVVFLDADVLPVRPIDDLFNIDANFAAAPDVAWPDIFNSVSAAKVIV